MGHLAPGPTCLVEAVPQVLGHVDHQEELYGEGDGPHALHDDAGETQGHPHHPPQEHGGPHQGELAFVLRVVVLHGIC